MVLKSLKKEECEKLLKQYTIGNLIKTGKVLKDDENSFGQIIYTTKGKYFVKLYRQFTNNTIQGLNLICNLTKQKYPTNGLILNNQKNTYSEISNKKISVFKFINQKERFSFTNWEISEIGKELGRLHKLTKKSKLKKVKLSWNHFNHLIKNHYCEKSITSNRIKRVLIYIHNNINLIKCNKKELKAASHVEFTTEHIRIKNNRIIYVLDWDLVGLDFCYYDIGSSLMACFKDGKLNFNCVNLFLKKYNLERKLSEWEKSHLFECVLFGCFKFCLWTLTNHETGKLNPHPEWIDDIKNVEFMMKLSKKEFYSKIK